MITLCNIFYDNLQMQRVLLSGSDDLSIRVWSLHSGGCLHKLTSMCLHCIDEEDDDDVGDNNDDGGEGDDDEYEDFKIICIILSTHFCMYSFRDILIIK